MNVYYEDDYSPCQIKCLLCLSSTDLLNANQNNFHKICPSCLEASKNSSGPENSLGYKSPCRICNSLTKIIFSTLIQDPQPKKPEQTANPLTVPRVPRDPRDPRDPQPSYSTIPIQPSPLPSYSTMSPSVSSTYNTNPVATIPKPGKFPDVPLIPYPPKFPSMANYSPSNSQNTDSSVPSLAIPSLASNNLGLSQQSPNKDTLNSGREFRNANHAKPVRPERSNNQKFFNCEHFYCQACRNKVQDCLVCRVKAEGKCVVCGKHAKLCKVGDYWNCEDCGYRSLECIACQSFDVLAPDELCLTCSCSWSGGFVCDRNHKFCKRCISKMNNNCCVCSGYKNFECKFCKTFDILCKSSVCPYCYSKSQQTYCILCKQS